MSRPPNIETLMSLADQIVWAAANYGSVIDTEIQLAEISVPVTTPKGEGHQVKVLYSLYTPDRVVLWTYDLTNTKWFGDELL